MARPGLPQAEWRGEIAERYRDEHRRAHELQMRLSLPATLATVFFGASWILADQLLRLAGRICEIGRMEPQAWPLLLAGVACAISLANSGRLTLAAARMLFRAFLTGRYGFADPDALSSEPEDYFRQMLVATRENVRTNRVRSEYLGSAVTKLSRSLLFLVTAGLLELLTRGLLDLYA